MVRERLQQRYKVRDQTTYGYVEDPWALYVKNPVWHAFSFLNDDHSLNGKCYPNQSGPIWKTIDESGLLFFLGFFQS